MKMPLPSASGVSLLTNTEREGLEVQGIKLTNRGRVVVALLMMALALWGLSATTPKECKVPVGEMSQFCVDFLYP